MKRRPLTVIIAVAAAMVAVLFFVSPILSSHREPARAAIDVPGGEAIRGEGAILDYGCTSCHVIPGVRVPSGDIGPPLTDWADRAFIAGRISNTPEHLIAWIMAPQSIDPESAMPDMGVPEAVARDMAAYLYQTESTESSTR